MRRKQRTDRVIDMKILAIETSCDETAVAVVEAWEGKNLPKFKVLSNVISSQIKLHSKFGGVVPNLASREHVNNLLPVFESALKQAGISHNDFPKKINMLAVTHGPGLIPCLLIGTAFAKTLSWKTQLPLIPVNHLKGHLYSNLLEHQDEIKFPAVCLIVSGGHTQLLLLKELHKHTLLGETRDDAAGEAFDKIARLLSLGYPGGPAIDAASQKGNHAAFALPRPMINSNDFDFSFAGLKTAVLYLTKKMTPEELSANTPHIAASAQEAIAETLISKTIEAAKQYKAKTILVAGGVAANKRLRELFPKATKLPVFFPPNTLNTDNAVMIAMAAYIQFLKQKNRKFSWQDFNANPNLTIA